MKRLMLLFVLFLLSLSVVSAQDELDADTLYVNTTETLGEISPYIFGSNMNLYSIIPVPLMEPAQTLGINFMRFGGGDTDRDDVRRTTIDLFMYQMRQLGAEPMMSARLLGGTPEAAADMVRYTNVEKDYNIRYWTIGNEPNLFVELMGVSSYTAHDLARDWRAIAEAMLEVDPDLVLVGPDLTQYAILNADDIDNVEHLAPSQGGDPFDENGVDWLKTFLEMNGDLVDVVSVHRYPFPGAGQTGATVEGLRANTAEWDVFIPNLRTVINAWAGRDIPIGVTEINSNSANSIGGEASLDSFYNALWLSDILGRMINNDVEIVTYWDMQGSTGRGWGLLGAYELRPTAYTYRMYTNFGTERLAAQTGDTTVNVYAAQREDGALTVMVINLGDEAQTKTLVLDGVENSAEAEVWRYDAEITAEQIETVTLSGETEITVPARSMTLYVFPAN